MAETDPKTKQDITLVVETLLQQMQDKFQIMSDQIIGPIGDMSSRIDDLEKNIADLMTQAGRAGRRKQDSYCAEELKAADTENPERRFP
ncbi:Heat shock factor-binding protein 1 [Lemmus lemmus]